MAATPIIHHPFYEHYPFGPAEKVWLSYEPENTHARDLYLHYGFAENGEMCGNEIVAVYDLHPVK